MYTLLLEKCTALAEEVSLPLKSSDFMKRVTQDPKLLLYGILSAILVMWILVRGLRLLYRISDVPPSTPDLEKPGSRTPTGCISLERKPGEWIPMDFKRPTASPHPNWDIHTSTPKPYRPFRYGPYHVTMGLRNMKWDEWIELDNKFLEFHRIKASRILERGSKCCKTSLVALTAAQELLHELCTYLPERYPTLFVATSTGMHNLVTGEDFDVTARPLIEDPMQMVARMIQDDLAIMVEKADGEYYLEAGSILLPGFWRLEDKFGMRLSDIHTSGDVPRFKEKLEKGMTNFFRRVMPSGPVERNNYFIQSDDDLAWSSTIGPEDSGTASWLTAQKNLPIAQHYFRSERQTLWRLPKSGGVVFTIRTYFVPVQQICNEPGVPGRLASAIRSWGEDVAKYKGRERYGDALLAYLDGEKERQVREGLVGEGNEEVEDGWGKYPF